MASVVPLIAPIDPALASELARRWPAIRPIILRYAYRLCRSTQGADDLAQKACEVVLRGRKWNREAYPTLEQFMCSVVGSLWTHDVRARVRSGEQLFDITDDHDPIEDVPTSKADPEQARMAYEDVKRPAGLVGRVLRKLEGDAVARGVVELTGRGIDDPKIQAEVLGASVDEVYNARKRLKDLLTKMMRRKS